jgi:Protein of unknown function (DUF4065)
LGDPVKFAFKMRKAAQAAAHILHQHGGRLNWSKLIRLLYLAERQSLVTRGYPIIGDQMVAAFEGPTLATLTSLVESDAFWTEYLSKPVGADIYLRRIEFDTDELSKFEVNLLDRIDSEHGAKDSRTLAMESRQLKEWRKPNSSSDSALPIDPSDILRLEGWSDPDIDSAESDAAGLLFLDSLAEQ